MDIWLRHLADVSDYLDDGLKDTASMGIPLIPSSGTCGELWYLSPDKVEDNIRLHVLKIDVRRFEITPTENAILMLIKRRFFVYTPSCNRLDIVYGFLLYCLFQVLVLTLVAGNVARGINIHSILLCILFILYRTSDNENIYIPTTTTFCTGNNIL